MNQTPHLQLNQWEKSDRIMMEDFNADNAKLDEALDRRAEYIVLRDVVTTEDSTRIEIDLSGIDLRAYRELYLRMENIDTCTNTKGVLLFLNEDEEEFLAVYYNGPNISSEPYLRVFTEFRLLPAVCLAGRTLYFNRPREDTVEGSESDYVLSPHRTEEIRKLTLGVHKEEEQIFYAGTHITLTGLKA